MSEDPWRHSEPGLHREPVPDTRPDLAYQEDRTLAGDLLAPGEPAPAGIRATGHDPQPDGDDRPAAGAFTADSDLAADLAAAAPRRWWNKATPYLGAAVLLVGGFVGGVQVQKHYGEQPDPAAGLAEALQNRLAQGGFGGGQGGLLGGGQQGGRTGGQSGAQQPGGSGTGSDPAGAATTGKVKLVDGTTVYVETANGDVVTVRTNGQTKVRDSAASSLKNLAAGDTVTVQGQSGSDGTVTATTVTEEKN